MVLRNAQNLDVHCLHFDDRNGWNAPFLTPAFSVHGNCLRAPEKIRYTVIDISSSKNRWKYYIFISQCIYTVKKACNTNSGLTIWKENGFKCALSNLLQIKEESKIGNTFPSTVPISTPARLAPIILNHSVFLGKRCLPRDQSPMIIYHHKAFHALIYGPAIICSLPRANT